MSNNFNSREVFKKALDKYSKILFDIDPLGYSNPNDNRSDFAEKEAAAILDSALLAAHPEAGELAKEIALNFSPVDHVRDDVVFLLSAALESAKREERRHTGVMDRNGREIFEGDAIKAYIYTDETPQILKVYYKDGGYLIDYKDSEADVYFIGWFPGFLEVVDSLAEKEGGR